MINDLRNEYHQEICSRLLCIRENKAKGDYPNNADGDSKISVNIANRILEQICAIPKYGDISGQTAGRLFEEITREFIEKSFQILIHLRPGKWHYQVDDDISNYDQYREMADIAEILKEKKELGTLFGQDYLIKPDIVVSREPVDDSEINSANTIIDDNAATLTPARLSNYKTPKNILHASISCKWTIRSDRVQNTRAEALNLIRNRKGKVPCIVAVTGEPTATRIASLALGTGDIDCVYHFALNELEAAIKSIKDESQLEMFNTLVDGRRLRDISDLPFDLII